MSLSTKPHQRSKQFLDFLFFHEYWTIECCIALLLFFLLKRSFPFPVPWIVAWDGFALTSIILTWLFVFTKDPYSVKKQLRLTEMASRFFFLVVIFAAIASVLSTWLLLGLVKKSSTPHISENITFALITIAISWTFVHTRFAGLYSHFFYRTKAADDSDKKEILARGLIFPGPEKLPDYWDFVYFSFVIGMTCQVADVGIAEHRLRRLVLLHGLLSFLFNTSIIALVVNIIAGLL